MSFISHSQNYEDVMLRRALSEIDQGFYIDVGANDPNFDSVTKAFYDAGWRGINIEPVTEWFEKLAQDRPEDTNLQTAIGLKKGTTTFYEIPGTGLSTSNKKYSTDKAVKERNYKVNTIKVPTISLSAICQEYVENEIHFLKIDVEGDEKKVVLSLDLDRFRPWIILIESTLPNSKQSNHNEWEYLLVDKEYEYAYFDGLNRFYVSKEKTHLKSSFSAPPNVYDVFSTSKLVELQQLSSELQQTNEHLANVSREDQAQLQILKIESDELKENYNQLSRDVLEKETRVQEHILSATEKETALQKAEAEITSDKSSIAKLEENAHHWYSTAEQHRLQIEDLQSQSAQAKENYDRFSQNILEKETRIQELILSVTEKETILQKAEAEIASNKASMTKFEENAHHWYSTAEQSRLQIEDLQSRSAQAKENHDRLSQDVLEKETKIQELMHAAEENSDRLSQDVLEKETRIQELILSAIEKETEQQKVEAEIASDKSDIKSLQEQKQYWAKIAEQNTLQLNDIQSQSTQTKEELLKQTQLTNRKEARIQELINFVSKKESQLQNARMQIASDKSDLNKLEENFHHWYRTAEQYRIQIEDLQIQSTQTEENSDRLSQDILEKETQIQELIHSVTEKETALKKAASEITFNKSMIENLESTNLITNNNLISANDEIYKILRSRSWKITWPLRKLAQGCKWIIKAPMKIFKIGTHSVLFFLIKRILGRPKIKFIAKKWLGHFPRLHIALRKFALSNNLIGNDSYKRSSNDQLIHVEKRSSLHIDSSSTKKNEFIEHFSQGAINKISQVINPNDDAIAPEALLQNSNLRFHNAFDKENNGSEEPLFKTENIDKVASLIDIKNANSNS